MSDGTQTTTGDTTQTSTAPVTTPVAPAPAAPAAPWHGITDPEGAVYIANKGWQTPADVIKSYQGAEKLIGRPADSLLVIPKPGDEAGWNQVYARLGRPESPDKYDMKAGVAEGTTPDAKLSEKMAASFHKAGLSTEQASLLSKEFNAFSTEQAIQAQKDYDLNIQTDKRGLLQKWGGGYERMMNSAQSAVASLGFNGKMVDAMEAAIGYGATMEFFADLGQKLGEHKFVSSSGASGIPGQLTTVEAQAEITKLGQDKVFQGILHDKRNPAYPAHLKKWQDLFAIAYPQ